MSRADQLRANMNRADQVVDTFIRSTKQQMMFGFTTKILERSNQAPMPRILGVLLSMGPIFITAKQAKKVLDILESKCSELHFTYHHVICIRVIDYWNLDEHYGSNCGSCYYGIKGNLVQHDLTLRSLVKSMPNSFKEYMYPSSMKEDAERFLGLAKQKKKRNTDGVDIKNIVASKRIPKKTRRFQP